MFLNVFEDLNDGNEDRIGYISFVFVSRIPLLHT